MRRLQCCSYVLVPKERKLIFCREGKSKMRHYFGMEMESKKVHTSQNPHRVVVELDGLGLYDDVGVPVRDGRDHLDQTLVLGRGLPRETQVAKLDRTALVNDRSELFLSAPSRQRTKCHRRWKAPHAIYTKFPKSICEYFH